MAEGNGLLNRRRGNSTEGSNPSLSVNTGTNNASYRTNQNGPAELRGAVWSRFGHEALLRALLRRSGMPIREPR